MNTLSEQIMELNANYNELGEDLLLLESLLQSAPKESAFPREYVSSSLIRINDYIQQHTKAINHMSEYLTQSSTVS